MPKIVDRDARRREIVDAYLDLLAERGVRATTGRAISERLGVSVGSLWHYFDDLSEVARQAAGVVFERDGRAIGNGGGTPLAELVGCIRALLPLDPRTRTEAELVTSFWGSMPAEQRSSVASPDTFVEPLTRLIERARAEGDVREGVDARLLAESINQLLDGAQVAHVLEPDLPPERHLARVAMLVVPHLGSERSPAALELRSWLGRALDNG